MRKTEKQLIVIFLAMSLIFVLFCGCDTAPADVSSTPGGSATGKVSPSATATVKATVKPTATPVPTPAYDKATYTIEFDVAITSANVGFLFAGLDFNNYIMAQFSIGEYNDGYVYYRPHQWIEGSWEVLDEVAIEPEVAPAEYNTDIHVKLEMKKHVLTVYVNGTEISELEVEDGTYDMFGFRTANGTPEAGTFDNIVITNAEGTVVLSENFEGETTYFDDALEEWNISVENGKLVVGESVDILLIDPPALNP